ncbi:MAG: o-succinylbenzoate--CoA ligase [Candidatus Marinimicrobia bacterium]|nr:o-succinylbenzoate--CoA ligase [Candidatus Neomarinimicrobiota bacterium]MBT3633179.1 o-succinylbenzoate--CoA ligase [Candidatus Neomarinimicrobiota bacterium]MBT3682220.1 o-succinylbenzoate--CoA ligase [Candidatus Neomarinimicrobiota bacterium]MBT3758779.1 o-succinylbenzoate--CoA ligase [Candidatus Neomarinimicrobiota bacterium]MBT3895347.1 o-succinylbenzoate--CoA ligase [Candidatus Neomarinimicrobiota bacterium]
MKTLMMESLKIASQLHKKGVSRQSRIMLSIDDPIAFIRFFLAGQNLGAVVIPLHRKFTNDEIISCFETVKPAILVTDQSHLKVFKKNKINQLSVDDFDLSDTYFIQDLPNVLPDPEDVCVILFTSGSTGLPKAVQLTAVNFISSARSWHQEVQFTEHDNYLLCLPVSHVGGLNIIIRALLYGFNISIAIDFNINKVNQLIYHQDISLISLVPTMMSRLLQSNNITSLFSSLRLIVIGGGPISDKLLKICRESNLPIMVSYGMTETCSGICGWHLSAVTAEEDGNYIGFPFNDVKLQVDDSEIVVSGPMVMKGYIGETDCRGIHYTGDLARISDDNKTYISGRKDNIIISGGENVSPEEVKNILMQIPDVNDCEVAKLPDNEWGMKIVAFIVLKNYDESRGLIKPGDQGIEIKNYCKGKLADYKIPKEVFYVNSIPRTDTGKVLKTKLMSIYNDSKH